MVRRKGKSGYVYVGDSTRRNGTVKQYTGSTTRSVKIREREHKKEVGKKNSRTWTGKGTGFKVTGSFKTNNPRKEEKKLKGMTKTQRNQYIARKNKSNYSKTKKKSSNGKSRSRYLKKKSSGLATRKRSSTNNYRRRRSSSRRRSYRRW